MEEGLLSPEVSWTRDVCQASPQVDLEEDEVRRAEGEVSVKCSPCMDQPAWTAASATQMDGLGALGAPDFDRQLVMNQKQNNSEEKGLWLILEIKLSLED